MEVVRTGKLFNVYLYFHMLTILALTCRSRTVRPFLPTANGAFSVPERQRLS